MSLRNMKDLQRKTQESNAIVDELSKRMARCSSAVSDLAAETRATLGRARAALQQTGAQRPAAADSKPVVALVATEVEAETDGEG